MSDKEKINTNIEYIVDARNRRIAKKVNGTIVQKFLYLNQLEPIAELDANDNIISLFIYGTRSNTPEYIIKGGVKYKVITNQLGSVIMVVNITNGTVEQSIEYDSFGNILSDSNPTFQPFRLAGGIYDNDTKLIRFGARDYDAREGRWTSKDPIKFDGGRNFYVYAENNPVNYVDLEGREPGKPYESKQEAIVEGFKDIFCKTEKDKKENGFWAFENDDGTWQYYVVTTDNRGRTNIDLGKKTPYKNAVSGHSHNTPFSKKKYYSKEDKKFYREYRWSFSHGFNEDIAKLNGYGGEGYFIDPAGWIWKYDITDSNYADSNYISLFYILSVSDCMCKNNNNR